MRTAVLLLLGFGSLAAGIAAFALGHPVFGAVLVVVALALKAAGVLLGDGAAPAPGRGPQTLGGQRVERPRPGIPVGRTNLRRGVVSPLRPPRPVPPTSRHERAS
ncbi:hypothetical protein GCM10023201_16840 [Actinomycetospora corticicola]|uniref:Uncharacterized protein n=1 Tax=Actinomycetospora corticicola TaxID=663602 RepID=A0A7Y9DV20_9PSEU|nr:hypothetical protein [Actinomycetospora corticicola]NYD35959.1 hypothetical protein [Actinomycetospora corticicola]